MQVAAGIMSARFVSVTEVGKGTPGAAGCALQPAGSLLCSCQLFFITKHHIPSEMLGTVLVTRLQCVGMIMSLAALKEKFFLELTSWGTITVTQSPASIHAVFIVLPLLLKPRTESWIYLLEQLRDHFFSPYIIFRIIPRKGSVSRVLSFLLQYYYTSKYTIHPSPPPADSSPYIAFMLIAFFVRAFEGVCEGKIV